MQWRCELQKKLYNSIILQMVYVEEKIKQFLDNLLVYDGTVHFYIG